MINEENTYFRTVVRDAISELKHSGSTFVFYEEQIQAIKEHYKKELIVKKDKDGFYRIVEKRGKKNDN